MKVRVKNKEAEQPVCQCCGIKKSEIDQLEQLNPDCGTPMLFETEDATFSSICSDCQFAIFEEIWDNLIQKKKLPLFHKNIKKHVLDFVKKNKAALEDTVSDYRFLLHIAKHITNRVDEMGSKNESPDSPTGGHAIPTTRDIYEYVLECNRNENNIRGNFDLAVKLDPFVIYITPENIDEIIEGERIKEAKEKMLKVKGICLIGIDVEAEQAYDEDPVKMTVKFLGIDERMKKETIDHSKTPDAGNGLLDIDSSCPTGGFTID